MFSGISVQAIDLRNGTSGKVAGEVVRDKQYLWENHCWMRKYNLQNKTKHGMLIIRTHTKMPCC